MPNFCWKEQKPKQEVKRHSVQLNLTEQDVRNLMRHGEYQHKNMKLG